MQALAATVFVLAAMVVYMASQHVAEHKEGVRTAAAGGGRRPNDDAMLKAAGWGVAVANAHPDTLQAADEVTDSNIDNGVAKVLEEMLA